MLAVDEADTESVRLASGEARIMMDRELSVYFIIDESPTMVSKDNEVHMEIVFKRRLTNEAVMTFLPSLLLISISYSTSFFKLPNFFNTAITVNLSVMLTLTTLLISVVKKLAQTSYIKWIEYWLIFAQLIPFTQVILITCIEALKEKRSEKMEGRGEEGVERSREQCLVAIGGKQVKVGNVEGPNYCRSVPWSLWHLHHPLHSGLRYTKKLTGQSLFQTFKKCTFATCSS